VGRSLFGSNSKKSRWPIGLDVGDHGVRLLQLAERSGALVAVAAAVEPLPAGVKVGQDASYHHAVAAAIHKALAKGAFTTHRVVSTLPPSAVQCKNLRLPKMPADEVSAAVQWEAADRFRMGEGQASVQFLDAGEVRQGDEVRQEVVLLAARLGFVEEHVKALTECGLRPSAIDAVPAALARRAEALTADAGQAVVWIDAGHGSTKVLIVRDGQVLFYKPIEIGGAAFDEALSAALGLSPRQAKQDRESWSRPETAVDERSGESEESNGPSREALDALRPSLSELGREIGLCLRYYGVTFRGARPERAMLVGGVASTWLAQALSESAGVLVSPGNPLEGIDLAAVRDVIRPGMEGAWGAAAGLCLRQYKRSASRVADSSGQTRGQAVAA